MKNPLADAMRPQSIDDMFGQKHLIGEGRLLRKVIMNGNIPNMIFFGPPGVGKTTLANIIANYSNKKFYKINATNSSVKDIKDIAAEIDTLMCPNGAILYVDELQSFSKIQQQKLLEFIEDGRITLIGSTADNPNFSIYRAVLSRCSIFQFKPLSKDDIVSGLYNILSRVRKFYPEKSIRANNDALTHIADIAGGDMRTAINIIELILLAEAIDNNNAIDISVKSVEECTQTKVLNYEKGGSEAYNLYSCLHKSLRGSDVDASIHYLARLIQAGDLLGLCRRILAVASEDVGLANPNAITIVKSCIDSALQLGFPEARLPLAQAVVFLALSPKSNSVAMAIDSALHDIETIDIGDVPSHLKDAHYSGAAALGHIGYKYPHEYPNHYVKQQYLPDNIKTKVYYKPCNNKTEIGYKEYWEKIKE